MAAPDDLLLFARVGPRRRPATDALLGPDVRDGDDRWELRDLSADPSAAPVAAAATRSDGAGAATLVAIAVAEGWRRQGVATRLLRQLGDALRADGRGIFCANVPTDAGTVIVLLHRAGFLPTQVSYPRANGTRMLCFEQPL